MATRYCGSTTIRVIWDDASSVYRCRVTCDGQLLYSVSVGAPAHLTLAVDSPEAYDNAARAACSFASDGRGADVSDHLDSTDAGWDIRRTKARKGSSDNLMDAWVRLTAPEVK